MSAPALFRRTLTGLQPVNDRAKEVMGKVSLNTVCRVEVKQPRNLRHHNKFWKLIETVHLSLSEHWTEKYPTPEALAEVIKILAGHAEYGFMPDGSEYIKAKSISFDKMDQTAFAEFYERTLDVICRHFLRNVRKDELRREIEELVGLPPSSAPAA